MQQFKHHTLTVTNANRLRDSLHQFRQAEIEQGNAVDAISELLGCSVCDALDLCNSRDGMRRTLDKLGIEVAPDPPPELRVVVPDDEAERWEVVEMWVIRGLALAMAGVAVWSWARWLGS